MLKFLQKLTLFSKILLLTFLIGIITFISIFCFSIYKINNNEYILNTNTGELLSHEGIYVRLPWSHVKFNNDIHCTEINAIVQDNSNNIYISKIIVYSNFDLNWIKTNKQIPKSINIPQDILNSYLNNSYSNYSIKELESNNRKLQFEIINQFLSTSIKDKGISIIRITIPYPLIKIQPNIQLNSL